jgi:hypothetical protein
LSWPLAPADRGSFLEAVAAKLAEHPELVGDGYLARIAVEVQRQFWTPPAVDGITASVPKKAVGKYGR